MNEWMEMNYYSPLLLSEHEQYYYYYLSIEERFSVHPMRELFYKKYTILMTTTDIIINSMIVVDSYNCVLVYPEKAS